MFGMTNLQLAFLGAIFLAVTGLCLGAFFLFRRSDLQRRLNPEGQEKEGAVESNWIETFVKITKPVAEMSVPTEGWEQSALRRKFIQAGLRSPSAPGAFFAFKTLFAFGLPILFWLFKSALGWKMDGEETAYVMLACMLFGFYLPNAYIDRLRGARQKELFESFPDALDLMTISMEAGLGMDQAITRVSREIRLESDVLADELELYGLEVRAGASRQVALRNLALRTGVEDIDSLVAMLVQSERFGTSVADALRVFSTGLRVKRQQRAEEAAAKVAVKLVFPLVLCIFPSILVVVAGPAIIQIGKIFGQLFGS